MSISTQCDELKRIPYQSDSAEHLSTMNSVAAASTTDEKHIDDTEEMSCCKKLGFTPIPRDKEDPRFIESFSSTSEHELQKALDFFNCYGFVVRAMLCGHVTSSLVYVFINRCSKKCILQKNVNVQGRVCGILLKKTVLDLIETIEKLGKTILLLESMV